MYMTSDLTEKIMRLYSYINDYENCSEQNISNIFSGIYIYIEYNRIYLGISSKCDFFHFSGENADDSGFEELSDKINKAFGHMKFIIDVALLLQSSGGSEKYR